jgi:hypothetical protein
LFTTHPGQFVISLAGPQDLPATNTHRFFNDHFRYTPRETQSHCPDVLLPKYERMSAEERPRHPDHCSKPRRWRRIVEHIEIGMVDINAGIDDSDVGIDTPVNTIDRSRCVEFGVNAVDAGQPKLATASDRVR